MKTELTFEEKRKQELKKAKRLWKKHDREYGKHAKKRKLIKEIKRKKPQGYWRFDFKDKKWQKLRKAVFRKYGKVCMKCGSTGEIHVDHIKPKSKYPELAYEFSNMQLLCRDCNYEKSNKNTIDYREKWEQEEYERKEVAKLYRL